jgi:hypothetical protein
VVHQDFVDLSRADLLAAAVDDFLESASDADVAITKKLKLAGEQLDIKVLDHIIITETDYYSSQDEGIF